MSETSLHLQDQEAARAMQWEADRTTQAQPLPYAELRHYENDGQRQTDLAAAEQSNIARAAGELGLTSTEWHALRAELGHSPTQSDVSRR
jgi:hypothetical protein